MTCSGRIVFFESFSQISFASLEMSRMNSVGRIRWVSAFVLSLVAPQRTAE